METGSEKKQILPEQFVRGVYDVIVVGAGHAGCEAALASARMGCKTLLITMNLDSIALMPCNPSMGGPAKGHLIKEIDALGGEIGRNTDRTFIQVRLLNTSKGPAVQALRAQCDKQAYRLAMKFALEAQPNLALKQATILRLLSHTRGDGRHVITGVVTSNGWQYEAGAIILTTGTFINGRLVVGEKTQPGGRAGEGPALGISDSLRALGLEVRRFKTGTPPRIDARSIDFSKTEPQPGSRVPLYFSQDIHAREDVQLPGGRPNPIYPVTHEDLHGWRPQLPCYLVRTNEQTHQIIRDNLHRSPLYTGIIEGIGPRYCPSIEDKIVRFADKSAHQIFLEPEGWRTGEVYVQGMNTSLPEDVQLQLHIFGETGIHALHVDLAGAPSLWFQKDLVRALIGEAHNLILDRGAVARANALNHARIERRTVQVVADNLVRAFGGAYQVAGQLRSPAVQVLICDGVDRVGATAGQLHILARGYVSGKIERDAAPRLWFRLAEIDGTRVDAWRRTGFEAPDLQSQRAQRLGYAQGRSFSGPAAGLCLRADDQPSIDESARRQDHSPGLVAPAVAGLDARDGRTAIRACAR